MPPTSVTHEPETLTYTVEQAALASGLSRTTIFALIKSGSLRSSKIGGRRLILKRELLRLIEDNEDR